MIDNLIEKDRRVFETAKELGEYLIALDKSGEVYATNQRQFHVFVFDNVLSDGSLVTDITVTTAEN